MIPLTRVKDVISPSVDFFLRIVVTVVYRSDLEGAILG